MAPLPLSHSDRWSISPLPVVPTEAVNIVAFMRSARLTVFSSFWRPYFTKVRNTEQIEDEKLLEAISSSKVPGACLKEAMICVDFGRRMAYKIPKQATAHFENFAMPETSISMSFVFALGWKLWTLDTYPYASIRRRSSEAQREKLS